MFFATVKWSVLCAFLITLTGTAWSHHDRLNDQGPDAILQHTEEKPELVMEMTLPHRRSVGNQLMLNFFAADTGDTVIPTSVSAQLSGSGLATNVILTGGDPTFGGALSTPQAGEWLLEVTTEHNGETVTFSVPIELH